MKIHWAEFPASLTFLDMYLTRIDLFTAKTMNDDWLKKWCSLKITHVSFGGYSEADPENQWGDDYHDQKIIFLGVQTLFRYYVYRQKYGKQLREGATAARSPTAGSATGLIVGNRVFY
jgi:hypothetical protein